MHRPTPELKKIYHKIALRNNLRDVEVLEIMDSVGKFIHTKQTEVNFKGIETVEEFKKIKTNFILKYLGKIYSNEFFFRTLKRRVDFNKRLKEKNNGRKEFNKE